MITISLHEVPHFLRNGLHYSSLLQNAESTAEQVNVPEDCFLSDSEMIDEAFLKPENVEDASKLFKTLLFWCVDILPETLLNHLFFSNDSRNDKLVLVFAHHEKTKDAFRDLVTGGLFAGMLELAEMMEPFHDAVVKSIFMFGIIEKDKVSLATQLRKMILTKHFEDPWIKQLQNEEHTYLQQRSILQQTQSKEKLVHTFSLGECACAYGDIECMEFLKKMNIPGILGLIDSALSEATRNGHLECLKYLQRSFEVTKEDMIASSLLSTALESGHIHCAIYLHETMGIPMNAMDAMGDMYHSCKKVVLNSRLDSLKYIFNNTDLQKTPILSTHAAQGKDDRCLKFLVEENEFPLPSGISKEILTFGGVSCIKYLAENRVPIVHSGYRLVVLRGDLSVLKLLEENGYDCHDYYSLCEFAASIGRLNCLQYLVQNSHLSNDLHKLRKMTEETVLCGELNCLKWLLNSGYYDPSRAEYLLWKATGCENVNGNLEKVRAIHEHFGVFDSETYNPSCSAGRINACTELAKFEDNIDCLRYVHGEMKIPICPEEVIASAEYGNVVCLEYYFNQSFTHMTKQRIADCCIVSAACQGQLQCLKFLFERGYTFYVDEVKMNTHTILYSISDYPDCVAYLRDSAQTDLF